MDFLRISSSILEGLFKKIDSTSKNIANSSTDGYMREVSKLSVENNLNIEKYVDVSRGNLIKTDSDYDIANQNDAFFVVTDGEKYFITRKGNLYLDEEGYIKIGNFYLVNRNNEKIKLEKGTPFYIERNGDIIQKSRKIDNIRVVALKGKFDLISYGNSIYYTDSKLEDVTPDILKGYIESSNVNPIEEMTSLIKILRNTEFVQKTINTEIDLTKKLISTSSKF
ncbi:MAG: hypothetical protein N2446_02045 [Elusimicrobiales bacterium]|nr:hypothetical protein [Elusimicrobiales bacterium]